MEYIIDSSHLGSTYPSRYHPLFNKYLLTYNTVCERRDNLYQSPWSHVTLHVHVNLGFWLEDIYSTNQLSHIS